MNERVLTLFSTHLNPLTKISNVDKKYFLPNEESTDEESEVVRNRLTNLYFAIKSERVDKRNSRSKGDVKDGANVKIIKSVGVNLSFMGYTYDKCKYLNGQEAMYIVETNRIEILQRSVPLSVQDCYNIFLDSKLTLSIYRVYRKISIDGFKLTLFKDWCLKNNDETLRLKRIKYEEYPEEPAKCTEDSNILKVLNRLRQNCPKESTETVNMDCDYKMYYPSNFKKDKPDMDIYVHTTTHFNPKYGFLKSKALFGLVTPNNIAFYRIGKVKIPTL